MLDKATDWAACGPVDRRGSTTAYTHGRRQGLLPASGLAGVHCRAASLRCVWRAIPRWQHIICAGSTQTIWSALPSQPPRNHRHLPRRLAASPQADGHGHTARPHAGQVLLPGHSSGGCAPGSQYMGMSPGFCSVHAWFASPLPARNAQGSSAVAARLAALLAAGVLERTAPDFDPVAVVRRAGGQVEAHPTARREVQGPRCAVVAPLLGLVPGLTLPEPDAVARRRAAACGTTTHSALREERSGRPTSRLRHTLTQVVQAHRRVGSGLDRPLRGIHDPLLVLQTLRQCGRALRPG